MRQSAAISGQPPPGPLRAALVGYFAGRDKKDSGGATER